MPEDLSPVLGDRIQLQQVLLNLVINSIEAMNKVPRPWWAAVGNTERRARCNLPIYVAGADLRRIMATAETMGVKSFADLVRAAEKLGIFGRTS